MTQVHWSRTSIRTLSSPTLSRSHSQLETLTAQDLQCTTANPALATHPLLDSTQREDLVEYLALLIRVGQTQPLVTYMTCKQMADGSPTATRPPTVHTSSQIQVREQVVAMFNKSGDPDHALAIYHFYQCLLQTKYNMPSAD